MPLRKALQMLVAFFLSLGVAQARAVDVDDFDFVPGTSIHIWWVHAQSAYAHIPEHHAVVERFTNSLQSQPNLLDPEYNSTLVSACKSVDNIKNASQCPVGLTDSGNCCGKCDTDTPEELVFPNTERSAYFPQANYSCKLQQVCSRCPFKVEGQGNQFIIVQANNPMFIPFTCNKVCNEGCAVILTRNAAVATVMRFEWYWWEWVLLGILVVCLIASFCIVRFCHFSVERRHQIDGLLILMLLTFGSGMIMLCAAGLPGTQGFELVSRTLGGNWQFTVYITGVVLCAMPTIVVFFTTIDLLLYKALWDKRWKDVSFKTLTYETLGQVAVACLVTLFLLLITPSKFDSNLSECLVYRNVAEKFQNYQGNFELWMQDSISTDQMVSIWLATSYTVSMFALVWSLVVLRSILLKLAHLFEFAFAINQLKRGERVEDPGAWSPRHPHETPIEPPSIA